MEFNAIIYEKENQVAIITLNRPKSLNAFNDESFNEITTVFEMIEKDGDVRAVIITGNERAFSSGDDIKFMTSGAITDGDQWVGLMQPALNKVAKCSKPVIAAISGLAMGGGCELALACDIRIAAEGTKFSLPEIKIAAIPVSGGIARLTKVVGPGWAKYLCLSGETILADTAFQIGLVNKVVAADKLMEEAKALADKLAELPPKHMAVVKKIVDDCVDVTIELGLRLERDYMNYLNTTEDVKNGARAWAEGRKPVYTGR